MRSDEDQGGSDRQCRLIQPSRHQIQRLTARPAPAEPDQYVARLECLGKMVNANIVGNLAVEVPVVFDEAVWEDAGRIESECCKCKAQGDEE